MTGSVMEEKHAYYYMHWSTQHCHTSKKWRPIPSIGIINLALHEVQTRTLCLSQWQTVPLPKMKVPGGGTVPPFSQNVTPTTWQLRQKRPNLTQFIWNKSRVQGHTFVLIRVAFVPSPVNITFNPPSQQQSVQTPLLSVQVFIKFCKAATNISTLHLLLLS